MICVRDGGEDRAVELGGEERAVELGGEDRKGEEWAVRMVVEMCLCVVVGGGVVGVVSTVCT